MAETAPEPGPPRPAPSEPDLVTVIVPAYNGSRTLPRTLDRLRAQDYRPVEWVVVDDGSRDPTPRLLAELTAGAPGPVEIVTHPVNLGLSRSLNDGLSRAHGDKVLIVHQDIELVGDDWIRRAAAHLDGGPNIAVVTAYYGVPAADELNLAMRAFGYIRQQFHTVEPHGEETVTFSEFKCDLFRRPAVAAAGNFPTQFRIAGEDIVLSFRLRQAGFRLLKCYDLVAVQRFTGAAESVRGNLYKDYRFGMAITGTLRAFGTYAFRHLDSSRYARSRSLHRASQPVFALALVLLLVLSAVFSSAWLAFAAAALLSGRSIYYAVRLRPEFRPAEPSRRRPWHELAAAAFLGIGSDLAYSLGVLVGAARSLLGARL
ncbi:MAG: glycosyltransferase family 2 protein [Thermoplasmata archaeon]|nr:glycosyltransferase family 2 protein [Thermoplasmata archaeon]